MAINKVEYGGNTLIDITDTTATSGDVVNGEVFYNADGTRGVGTLSMGNAKTYYGTCSTSASTQAKVVTCSGFVLEEGATIDIKFSNKQSYNGAPTLNINSTGAISITNGLKGMWGAGDVVRFVYDGTTYRTVSMVLGGTATYGAVMLSTDLTSTATNLAATISTVHQAYNLADSKQDVLTFDTTPTSNSTNPVTSGGVFSDLYNNYVGYSSWDTSTNVYSVSNKSSVANLLAVDSNNKVKMYNLPTASSITNDATTIPRTDVVYSALSTKADTSSIPTVPTTLSSFTDDLGSSPTHTHSQYLNSSSIVDLIYPVGSIYMSVNSTSPQTLFGGTWVQLEDTFLLGAGSTYTAGSTGGSASHTLTTDELPAHTHGSETLSGSITIRAIDSVTSNNTNLLQQQSGIITRSNDSSVNGYRSSSSNYRTAQSSQYNQINVNATHEHDSVGNGDAFSTLPPYLTVYMWKRTA